MTDPLHRRLVVATEAAAEVAMVADTEVPVADTVQLVEAMEEATVVDMAAVEDMEVEVEVVAEEEVEDTVVIHKLEGVKLLFWLIIIVTRVYLLVDIYLKCIYRLIYLV